MTPLHHVGTQKEVTLEMAFVTSNAMRLIRLHLSDGTGYDEDHAQLVFLKCL